MKDVSKELQESGAAATTLIRDNFDEICAALTGRIAYSPVMNKVRLLLTPHRSFEESARLAADLLTSVIKDMAPSNKDQIMQPSKMESLNNAIAEVNTSIAAIERAINSTPTGDTRNDLTDANILLHVAKLALQYNVECNKLDGR